MFKLIWNLIKLLFLTALLAIIFQQFTARFALSLLLRAELGVPVEVEHAQVDFLKAQVRFQNIEIWNPEGFPPGVMIYIREIIVDSRIPELFQNGSFNLDRLEWNVDNVRLAQTSNGQVNLFALKLYQKPEASILKDLNIGEFVLSTGRAGFSSAAARTDVSREIGLNRMTYRKVRTLRDIFDILGWETLKAMNMEKLGRGYLSQIGEDLDNAKLPKDFSAPRNPAWH